jgi:predicted peptidase
MNNSQHCSSEVSGGGKIHLVCLILFSTVLFPLAIRAAEPAPKPKLVPGETFTVQFPGMPPTFYALFQKKEVMAQMTVCLPNNYDPAKKIPLLIFLNGWDGGDGTTLGYARGLTEGRDFICVSMPLFRAPGFQVDQANTPGANFIMVEEDGKFMWPFFKTMLDKVEELVPNIDTAHLILGGFSQGAHATAALIDGSEGEATRRFSAFLIVEGGGKMAHYERLKDKAYMMVSSNAKSRPRAGQICEAAKKGGARTTFLCEDVGKHDFPVSAYPKVRIWLNANR